MTKSTRKMMMNITKIDGVQAFTTFLFGDPMKVLKALFVEACYASNRMVDDMRCRDGKRMTLSTAKIMFFVCA
jgi:hypothetical protein